MDIMHADSNTVESNNIDVAIVKKYNNMIDIAKRQHKFVFKDWLGSNGIIEFNNWLTCIKFNPNKQNLIVTDPSKGFSPDNLRCETETIYNASEYIRRSGYRLVKYYIHMGYAVKWNDLAKALNITPTTLTNRYTPNNNFWRSITNMHKPDRKFYSSFEEVMRDNPSIENKYRTFVDRGYIL